MDPRGGGIQLWVACHVPPKKTLLFRTHFHRKIPTFTNCHPLNDPLFFDKLTVTERPRHTFVTQRALIFSFVSQKSDKLGWGHEFANLLSNFAKFLAIFGQEDYNFWLISALSLKDHLFPYKLSLKDPYVCGARWHSYRRFHMWVSPHPAGMAPIKLMPCAS